MFQHWCGTSSPGGFQVGIIFLVSIHCRFMLTVHALASNCLLGEDEVYIPSNAKHYGTETFFYATIPPCTYRSSVCCNSVVPYGDSTSMETMWFPNHFVLCLMQGSILFNRNCIPVSEMQRRHFRGYFLWDWVEEGAGRGKRVPEKQEVEGLITTLLGK